LGRRESNSSVEKARAVVNGWYVHDGSENEIRPRWFRTHQLSQRSTTLWFHLISPKNIVSVSHRPLIIDDWTVNGSTAARKNCPESSLSRQLNSRLHAHIPQSCQRLPGTGPSGRTSNLSFHSENHRPQSFDRVPQKPDR
jgi:hypothetical protein